VSEGITDYYADLALVRGGIVPAEAFYQTTAGKMSAVANTAPVSLQDASLSTWIGPTDGTFFIYYPKGSVVGFLLDILIRDASDNRTSLDNVMRDLYQRTYKHDRGFTTDDWWLAVGRATRQRSFADFYSRFIRGRESLPDTDVLPRAGLRLATDTVRFPRIGISTGQDDEGIVVTAVSPETAASAAGVMTGDHLVSVGDVQVADQTFGNAFRERYGDAAEGSDLPIVVRRGTETVTLPARLRFATRTNLTLKEDPDASPKAIRIRQGILTGEVDK
jgi:predicted metalloprotease with PDZ domain